MTQRSTPKPPTAEPPSRPSAGLADLRRWLAWLAGLAVAGVAGLAMVIGLGLAMAYPNLPDVTELADYRPKLPLRVYATGGELIGEFGEERRNLLRFNEIPPVMVQAVLAIEDARFFEHSGVDYRGMLRAALANLGEAKSQGASTITMQVARNVYLSSEKSYLRKIYEVLLTFKLEHLLTKEQILEIYMNQISWDTAPTASPRRHRPTSANPLKTSPWPKRPCSPACPRPPRPTTRSATPSGPAHGSCTSSNGCWTTASSPPSRPLQRSRNP